MEFSKTVWLVFPIQMLIILCSTLQIIVHFKLWSDLSNTKFIVPEVTFYIWLAFNSFYKLSFEVLFVQYELPFGSIFQARFSIQLHWANQGLVCFYLPYLVPALWTIPAHASVSVYSNIWVPQFLGRRPSICLQFASRPKFSSHMYCISIQHIQTHHY